MCADFQSARFRANKKHCTKLFDKSMTEADGPLGAGFPLLDTIQGVIKMNGRRAIIGLSLLCALVFSAYAAPSAFAVKGTTAFTCVKKAGGTLRGEHCLTTGTATQEFTHEEIAVGTLTETEGTNEKTANTTGSSTEPLLTAVSGGVNVEISCENESATGKLENQKPGAFMKVKGSEIVIIYTKCVTKGALAELECKVKGEEVKTEKLTSETGENGMTVEFKPPVETFTTITLEGCTNKAFNEAFPVKGTVKAIPEGATLRTSNLTSTGLKFGAANASLYSNTTVRMKRTAKEAEEKVFQNPISLTTTEP
jgi:hypothetical protein